MSSTTICQRSIKLKLGDRDITVRRMYWKAARAFIKNIAKHLATTGTDLTDIMARLPELVASVDELVIELITNSSDLSADDLDKLDVAEAAAVLNAALELNLGEDLKNSFAGIAKTLGNLRPALTTTSGAESTRS